MLLFATFKKYFWLCFWMKKCLHKIILSLVLHAYSFENQLGDFWYPTKWNWSVYTHEAKKRSSEIKTSNPITDIFCKKCLLACSLCMTHPIFLVTIYFIHRYIRVTTNYSTSMPIFRNVISEDLFAKKILSCNRSRMNPPKIMQFNI